MSIDKLLAAGSSPLRRLSDTTEATFFHRFGHLGSELIHFLQVRNGFFAFEAALHVFPSGGNGDGFTLELWNRLDTWRSAYGKLIPND